MKRVRQNCAVRLVIVRETCRRLEMASVESLGGRGRVPFDYGNAYEEKSSKGTHCSY